MPTVESAGTEIAWEAIGPADGRPVLIVHGFGSNRASNWLDAGWADPLVDAGFHGILVDLRGHGASGRPVGPEHYRPELFLDDLLAVLDALGLERVGVLGYSFGARLGWDLAIAAPERIDRLVLGGFSPASPMADFDVEAARAFIADGTEIADPITAALMRMSALVPGADLARLVDVVEGVRAGDPSPVDAGVVPAAPTCIVVGERDEVALGAAEFAARVGAEFVPLKARSHTSAISARAFKEAAVRWLSA